MIKAKTKLIIIILSILAIPLYLFVSPVFGYTEYTMDSQRLPNSQNIRFDIGDWGNESFQYHVIYSEYKNVLSKNGFYLEIQDYGKTVNTFEIITFKTIIDGEPYIIDSAANQVLELDRTVTNGYAGQGGTQMYRFELPKVPKNDIVYEIYGLAHYDNGKSLNQRVVIKQEVYTKTYTMPLIDYIFRDL